LLSARDAAVPGLAEPLVKLSEWLRGQGDVTGAITAVQRATAGRTPSRELLPAYYALAMLLEEHGDLRSAATTLQKVVEYDYGFRDAAQRLQTISGMLAAEDSSGAVRLAANDAPSPDPTGRYTIEEEIGRGGMGVVYRAHDTRLGRTVAIKVLHAKQHTPDAIRRFEREARAAAALSHPGIVHIYDFDRGFGSYFIAMEHVSGPTLIALLRTDPTFVRWNLKALMRQIVDAVAYAHAAHVVHRDLKPANMVLADRKQVKILDFGIARRIDDHESTASGATGTPYYMAPEQILGEQPDERTDVYALGVTFFLMTTGKLPFASGNVLRAHLEQQPPDPKTLVPDLDEALRRLILRCLAKNPDDRYRSGAALLAAVSTRTEELLR
jgi:serine/threonine protein kinase